MNKILRGLKVVDFTWIVAGPLVTLHLAAHGATVVKVESTSRPDGLRVANPYKDNIPGMNRSVYFSEFNPNKYSMNCNLAHPKGIELAKRLIQWADIVVDNFAPGVMKRRDLDYEKIMQINPKVIMLSLSFPGQDGPETGIKGYGHSLAAFAGFVSITGWPDKDPVPPFGAYTDFIAPRFACAALLAALIYRKRTGRGLYLDMSQFELSLQFLSPLILDFNINGRVAQRDGNRSPHSAPHGVYPCKGNDRWCAISVHLDEEWKALCKVMGKPNWTNDEIFATARGRKENEEKLDSLVSEWTISQEPEELMVKLQKNGVQAGVVRTPSDIGMDTQLSFRKHYQMLTHPEIGYHSYASLGFKMSKADDRYEMPAPCLGEHTEFVCTELLGLTDKEFMVLLDEGAFE